MAAGYTRGQRGIALIAILLLLVFMLTIVGGLFYRHQIHIQKVSRALVGEQALLLALSAESWAKSLLRDDTNNIDDLDEDWARQLPPMPVEGGKISGCIIDLQARFNLNNLGNYSNKTWNDELEGSQLLNEVSSPRTILRRLLEFAQRDGSDSRIASLVDWVDIDSWLVSPDSAEDNEYLLLDPPYRPANHFLVELSELNLVQGFSTEDVAALEPWVSTLPELEAAVNVNTAPPPVLMALHPAITVAVAKALAEQRPFDNLDLFYDVLAASVGVRQETLYNELPAELLAVSSDYFQLSADVELAGVRVAYSSLIHRQGERTRVFRRTLRYIPAVTDSDGKLLEFNSECNRPSKESPLQ